MDVITKKILGLKSNCKLVKGALACNADMKIYSLVRILIVDGCGVYFVFKGLTSWIAYLANSLQMKHNNAFIV